MGILKKSIREEARRLCSTVDVCSLRSGPIDPESVLTFDNHMQKGDSCLRVLICTSAFGMGIDCKAVHNVVHWGPPEDIEAYVQEVGRGGRDGSETQACLYFDKGGMAAVDANMKRYCMNEALCRRKLLMSYFVQDYSSRVMRTCKCCDVCRQCCNCAQCIKE